MEISSYEELIDLLGHRVKDVVTESEGVVTSICVDLFGCCQVVITPPVKKDGDRVDSHWFDTSRLKVTSARKVMEPVAPSFEMKLPPGPAEKPIP